MCNACGMRGKTWNGSDPRCAFTGPVFSTENWNCATMGMLRDLVALHGNPIYNEDNYCAVLPVFSCGEYLVLSWYKSRGRTEGAWVVSNENMTVLTLAEAETILKQWSSGKRAYIERPTA